MKKKYQITLVVIGCLIVLIGLSYAYFMVNSSGGGIGGSVTVNTVNLDEVGFSIEGELEFNDLDVLPGHKNISKIKVTAIGNNDVINYKLVWEGINSLNTPLKYYVYKTTTSESPSITCNKETEIEGASKIYYETCTENNFDNLGSIITSGEITKTTETEEFILARDEVIKGTSEGNVIYYYVVLEYPNLNESQNIDMGGSFNGIVTVKKVEGSLADITIKKIYKQTDTGYQEINKIPEETGYVLNTEQSTCTNNATPVYKNNKILITNLTSSDTECNIYFDRDTEKPIIANLINTVTENSITVIVEATDNVEVTEYYYAIDDGDFVQGESDTYTFTELGIGSTHTVRVYVKDSSRNQSDTTTKEITTTPDTTKPVVTDVSTSVTKTEITVTVTAHDNNGTVKTGVAEYWYQIDSETPVKKTTNTHIFTGLSAGSTHTIKVYVKDGGGNPSDTITKENVTTTAPTSEDTLAKLNITNYSTSTPTFSSAATTDEGIFRVSDGMYGGYSYYWRGAVTNNHVIFANKCWRIVRINGDGSIRLIYNGAASSGTCTGNGTNSAAVIMGSTDAKKYYATSDGRADNSSYVGWTYTFSSQRPSDNATATESNAKVQTENWFASNITGTNLEKVANGYFCNDRNTGPGGGTTKWSATGTYFRYAAHNRINTGAPTLSCSTGDVYTLKVGAITADEAMFAGGLNTNNTSYYLYSGQKYWTMSPSYWGNDGYAAMFEVNNNGTIGGDDVNRTSIGLRPVINLNSNVTFNTGSNGTQSNPYIVQ